MSLAEGPCLLGGRIKGTLGDIDPLNKVPLKRARSRVQKGYPLRGLPNTTPYLFVVPNAQWRPLQRPEELDWAFGALQEKNTDADTDTERHAGRHRHRHKHRYRHTHTHRDRHRHKHTRTKI